VQQDEQERGVQGEAEKGAGKEMGVQEEMEESSGKAPGESSRCLLRELDPGPSSLEHDEATRVAREEEVGGAAASTAPVSVAPLAAPPKPPPRVRIVFLLLTLRLCSQKVKNSKTVKYYK